MNHHMSTRNLLPHAVTLVVGLTNVSSAQDVINGNTGATYVSPSAAVSTNTTGGTNINYQTNNAYNNEFGFAPGIFCRTPTLFIGGGAGQVNSYTKDDPYSASFADNYSYNWQNNANFNGQVGLVVPIASSVIDDCKSLSRQIAEDRRISTELSMIRACAALEKEGLTIDPEKYPLLSRCLKSKPPAASASRASMNQPAQVKPAAPVTKMPATTRL